MSDCRILELLHEGNHTYVYRAVRNNQTIVCKVLKDGEEKRAFP